VASVDRRHAVIRDVLDLDGLGAVLRRVARSGEHHRYGFAREPHDVAGEQRHLRDHEVLALEDGTQPRQLEVRGLPDLDDTGDPPRGARVDRSDPCRRERRACERRVQQTCRCHVVDEP
jgi:hypothetical protein